VILRCGIFFASIERLRGKPVIGDPAFSLELSPYPAADAPRKASPEPSDSLSNVNTTVVLA
jgi:hypothetical protein